MPNSRLWPRKRFADAALTLDRAHVRLAETATFDDEKSTECENQDR